MVIRSDLLNSGSSLNVHLKKMEGLQSEFVDILSTSENVDNSGMIKLASNAATTAKSLASFYKMPKKMPFEPAGGVLSTNLRNGLLLKPLNVKYAGTPQAVAEKDLLKNGFIKVPLGDGKFAYQKKNADGSLGQSIQMNIKNGFVENFTVSSAAPRYTGTFEEAQRQLEADGFKPLNNDTMDYADTGVRRFQNGSGDIVTLQLDVPGASTVKSVSQTSNHFNADAAKIAFETVFKDGKFDAEAFKIFAGTVLGYDRIANLAEQPLGIGDLAKIAGAMGFSMNMAANSSASASAAGALLNNKDVAEAFFKSGVNGTVKLGDLADALGKTFSGEVNADAYNALLQSSYDQTLSPIEAMAVMKDAGSFTAFIQSVVGDKSPLNTADLTNIMSKLGFNTLNEALHNKDIGPILASYKIAEGEYSIPLNDAAASDDVSRIDFVSQMVSKFKAVAALDGNAGLNYGEYRSFLDEAFFADSSFSSAKTSLDPSTLITGTITRTSITKYFHAQSYGTSEYKNAAQMSAFAQSLGFPSLAAMLDPVHGQPDIIAAFKAANKNGGVSGYVNLNVEEFLNGVDGVEGTASAPGFIDLMMQAARSNGVASALSPAELKKFIDKKPVITATVDPIIDTIGPIDLPPAPPIIGVDPVDPAPPVMTLPSVGDTVAAAEQKLKDAGFTKVIVDVGASGPVYGYQGKDGKFFTLGIANGKVTSELSSMANSPLTGNYGTVTAYLKSKGYNYVAGSNPPEFKRIGYGGTRIVLQTEAGGSSGSTAFNVIRATAKETTPTTTTTDSGIKYLSI